MPKERKLIEVTVDRTGATSIDLRGFHGQGCSRVMAWMTANADEITHAHDKPEAFEEPLEVEMTERRTEVL